MAKTNNLKDFLTDLYEGIASKKPNASRNPQDFRSEIENISGGATIKAGGGGTLYKTNEYVEKLYFNTSLSVEEVDNYLSQLEYADGMYNLFVDDIQVIGVMDASAMGINGYIIMSNYNDGSSLTLIYCSNSTLAQQMGENFEGWNTTFEGVLELNSTSYEVSPNNDLPVNPSNITSDLVSTTPFTPAETIELSGEYDGSTIEVTDLSGGWQGTVVPNSGYVENVYLNTNLSVDEVVSLLEKLEQVTVAGTTGYVFLDNDEAHLIVAMKEENIWAIGDFTTGIIYFCSENIGEDFVGWNPSVNYPIPIKSEINSTLGDINIATQNDKLTSLFSTTPFTKSEENTINIKKYINEKKIPLSIKVNVEGAGGTPIELTTSDEMNAVLTSANIGKIYKYTGTTNDTYTNGELYQVVEEA